MPGLPFAKFYWNDWAGDPLLRTCSFAAQGYWMRLLCIAAESSEPGFVLLNKKAPEIEDLVLVTGGTAEEVRTLIAELHQRGVCGMDRRGVIYSRRLVREEIKRSRSAAGGKKGGPATVEKQTGIHTTRGPTRNPYSKPESRVQNPESRVDAGARDFKSPKTNPEFANAIKLCEELGYEFDPTGNHRNWPSLIQRMIDDDGLDLDFDIIAAVPTLRANGRLPEEVRSPTFLRSQAIAICEQRRTQKIVPIRKPEDMTREDWHRKLKRFLECGAWTGFTAAPVYRACPAPPDLLAQCRAIWAKQGNHPEFADADCNFVWKPEGDYGMRGIIWPAAMPVEGEERAQA